MSKPPTADEDTTATSIPYEGSVEELAVRVGRADSTQKEREELSKRVFEQAMEISAFLIRRASHEKA